MLYEVITKLLLSSKIIINKIIPEFHDRIFLFPTINLLLGTIFTRIRRITSYNVCYTKLLRIQAIGLMSGTSLDGLDICCTTFQKSNDQWAFKIDCSKAYSYSDELKEKLGNKAQQMSAIEFVTFHSEYGKFLGKRVNDFMKEFHVKPDIIASHGHTIFHKPEKQIMFQIGDGAAIAAETHIPTVSDFRRLDIMLGGQGAPRITSYNVCYTKLLRYFSEWGR